MNRFIQKNILLLTVLLCCAQSVFAQWTPYATVTNSIIWNIAFADKNTVYAVGPGALMKSYDGGHSWMDLMLHVPTPDSNLYNLYFLNKDTGFVFSNDVEKNVFRTLDGGNIWTDVSQPALSIGLLDMQFASSTVGYATCGYQSDSTLSKTTDGGLTWRRPLATFTSTMK